MAINIIYTEISWLLQRLLINLMEVFLTAYSCHHEKIATNTLVGKYFYCNASTSSRWRSLPTTKWPFMHHWSIRSLSRNFHRLNFQHCGKPLVLLKLKKNEWLSKLDYMLYFKTIFTYYVFRFTSFFYKYLGDDLIVATDKKAMEIF